MYHTDILINDMSKGGLTLPINTEHLDGSTLFVYADQSSFDHGTVPKKKKSVKTN